MPGDDGSAQGRIQAAQLACEPLASRGAGRAGSDLAIRVGGECVADLGVGPPPGGLAEQIGIALRHSGRRDGAEPAEPLLREGTVRAAAARRVEGRAERRGRGGKGRTARGGEQGRCEEEAHGAVAWDQVNSPKRPVRRERTLTARAGAAGIRPLSLTVR